MPSSRIFAAATTDSASRSTQGIGFRPSLPNSPLPSEYGLYGGKYVCLLLMQQAQREGSGAGQDTIIDDVGKVSLQAQGDRSTGGLLAEGMPFTGDGRRAGGIDGAVDLDWGAGAVPITRRDRLAAVRYGRSGRPVKVVYMREVVMDYCKLEGSARRGGE